MKFENTTVMNFKNSLRGMRNPMNSWDKSDSLFGYNDCGNCGHNHLCEICFSHDPNDFSMESPIIGENDLKLAQKLILSGDEHRKFMRQIFVSVDITAPLYWWKEFDQYKIGIITNSTSTMHKITSSPITLDCFEIDDFDEDVDCRKDNYIGIEFGENFLNSLEYLRLQYLETKDRRYWKELIRWTPSSWLQTRAVTMNYENIRSIYFQRKIHKLNEWSGLDNSENENFCSWVKKLPYAKELILIDKQ